MKRTFSILLMGLALIPLASAQKARLDSLLHVLNTQPKADAARLRTLTALARTDATIDPRQGLDLAKQAVTLARELGDERGLGMAWDAQRWCLFYMGEQSRVDSISELIAGAAQRTKDVCLFGLDGSWMRATDDLSNDDIRVRKGEHVDSALAALRLCNDKILLADCLLNLGSNPWLNTDMHRIEEAERIYRSIGDSSGVAFSLSYATNYPPYVNDPLLARARTERALALFKEDGNRVGALWMHSQLVWICGEVGDFVGAVRHGQAAVDLATALRIHDMLGGAQQNLSESYMAMGDLRRARDLARAAVENCRSVDYKMGARNGLGKLYLLVGEPDSARQVLEQAIKEYPFRGDDLRYAEARGYLAMALVELGDPLRASALFAAALEVHRKYPTNYAQDVQFSIGFGRLLAHADENDLRKLGKSATAARREGLRHLEHALELGKEHHLLKEQQDALAELARLHELEGHMAKAFEYQKRYAVMKDSVNNADMAKAVARMESAYEEEQRAQVVRAEQARKDAEAAEKLRKQKLLRNWLIGGAAFLALFGGVVLFQRNRIRKERDRSENLLLNILPSEIAAELKAKGRADARDFEMVSILFTDFKGFTEASAKLSAQDLVTEINTCFEAFDGIIGRYGIEKIKTIGDAYMAAGGLPVPTASSVKYTVLAALEMQAFITHRKATNEAQGKPAFEMRVGIHTGPVVAGIVGVKKFQYDIWGDTVNTASRMESSSEVGEVNISEATYELVKNEPGLTFTPRGKVQAKGKGELEMYFVTRDLAGG